MIQALLIPHLLSPEGKYITATVANLPANEWSVTPPMWQAATPVLAVATVTSGGKAPMIRRSRYDLPVPALPARKCSYCGSSAGSSHL